MKTKIEIIENLCNNGAIDFREALILLEKEKEVNELVNKGVNLANWTITTPPNYVPSASYISYCQFLPSAMDARVCVTCGKGREFHKIK